MKYSYPALGENQDLADLNEPTLFPVGMGLINFSQARKVQRASGEAAVLADQLRQEILAELGVESISALTPEEEKKHKKRLAAITEAEQRSGMWEQMLEMRDRILGLAEVDNLRDLNHRSGESELTETIRWNIAREYAIEQKESARETREEPVTAMEKLRRKVGDVFNGMRERLFGIVSEMEVQESDIRLRRLAQEADELVGSVVERFFPGHRFELSMVNEIKNCHDPGRLLAIACDDSWDSKAQFEAKRKLILMDLMKRVNQFLKQQEMNSNNLSYFDELMGRHLYANEGKGGHRPKMLVTAHDRHSHECIDSMLVEYGEGAEGAAEMSNKNPGHSVRTTPISFRTFEHGENGYTEDIEFMVDSRTKSRTGLALKLLRKDSGDLDDIMGDLNGVRLVFRGTHDVRLFEMTLKHNLKEAGYDIEFTRTKKDVGGDGEEGGGGGISCLKHNIDIIGPDGKTRNFELQILTLEEFSNYLYQRPYSWAEYEVSRFFDSSSSEALFPDEFYPVDRKQIAKHAKELNYRRAVQTHTKNSPAVMLVHSRDEGAEEAEEAQSTSA